MNTEKLYPYVVPAGYIDVSEPGPPGFHPMIGHEVYVQLVEDMNGICRMIQPDELLESGLDVAAGHRLAIENLQALAETTAIQKGVHETEGGQRFIVWSGHWLAASCIRLPGIADWAKNTLAAPEICASIPQRESLLFFPKVNRQFRDQMREMIRTAEEGARKPVTLGFFSWDGDNILPLNEAS